MLQGYAKDETGDVYPMPIVELATKLNYAKDDDIENVSFNLIDAEDLDQHYKEVDFIYCR